MPALPGAAGGGSIPSGGTSPCRESLSGTNIEQMNNLVSNGVIDVYPPLMDIPGSFSAQFEHVRPALALGLPELIHCRLSFWVSPARRSSVAEMTIDVGGDPISTAGFHVLFCSSPQCHPTWRVLSWCPSNQFNLPTWTPWSIASTHSRFNHQPGYFDFCDPSPIPAPSVVHSMDDRHLVRICRNSRRPRP